ncbi:MAG: shikimate kinase [Nitrospirota bacterium]
MSIEGRHIVLVGMMGTGKTAIGRSLARRLGRPFIDTDRLIEAQEGCSIAQLFEAKGEPAFRELESGAIREVVTRPPSVIATGGGAVLRKENRELLKQHGLLIWLKADIEEMLFRTAGRKGARPLLTVKDPRANLQRLLTERESLYAEADFTVETTGRSVSEATSMILHRIGGDRRVRREER